MLGCSCQIMNNMVDSWRVIILWLTSAHRDENVTLCHRFRAVPHKSTSTRQRIWDDKNAKCVDRGMHSVSVLAISAKFWPASYRSAQSERSGEHNGRESNCWREMPLDSRGRDVDPTPFLWSRFQRLLKLRCSALSSYLWIGLLVGVENLFGCSRAGRFTQLDGFVPCTV